MALGKNNQQIARELQINRETVRIWRGRWLEARESLISVELQEEGQKQLMSHIRQILSDAPRPGAPATFTPEQIVQVVAVACSDPAVMMDKPSHAQMIAFFIASPQFF